MPDGKRCGPSLIAEQEEAERAGFEPAVRFDPHTAFPVPHLRPLGHLSGGRFMISRASQAVNAVPNPVSGSVMMPVPVGAGRGRFEINLRWGPAQHALQPTTK